MTFEKLVLRLLCFIIILLFDEEKYRIVHHLSKERFNEYNNLINDVSKWAKSH